MLNNPLCYEIMTPESVGMPPARIVLGKHSGRHALRFKYRELGYEIDGEELNQVYGRFTQLADRKKKVYDKDLISLLITHRAPFAESQSSARVQQ